KEVARALTGWYANYPRSVTPENPREYVKRGGFFPWLHDADEKTALGQTVPADDYGSSDVTRIVDAIMQHPTTAPFIAKYLLQKLASETPDPAYVARVASVFAASGGDIRPTVAAILNDPEFYSPEIVRSQFKTPIEHFIGAIRGLGVTTPSGQSLY